MGELSLPNFKTHYKGTVIKTSDIGKSTETVINGTDYRTSK